MKAINNKYRYTIQSRLGFLQVAPLGESDFKLQWERKVETETDYEKNFPDKIKFANEAYQLMVKIEKSIYRCDVFSIEVERYCLQSGDWIFIPWFKGQFSLNSGDWDLSRCEVTIQLDDSNVSKCVDDNKNTLVNLLEKVTTKVVVKTQPPSITIEKVYASKTGSTSGLIYTTAWDTYLGPSGEEMGYGIFYNNYMNTGGSYSTFTSWARMVMTQSCATPIPPEESGWILIEDTCPSGNRKFAKPVTVYDCQYSYPLPPGVGIPVTGSVTDCKILGDTEGVFELKNGMHLKDCIQAFLTVICPGKTIVSDFFQINPVNVSSTNYVTLKATKTNGIVVFQKSDVKRPTAESATKAETEFEKFMNAICLMFNCKWRIIGSTFRLEHISFWDKAPGLNLTVGNVYPKYIKDMLRYSYNTPAIPQREEFKFMEASQSGDFPGRPILYDGGCVSKESKDNVKLYSTEIVTTDVQLCISNPNIDSKVVDDDGFVFVATVTNGSVRWILSEEGVLVPDTVLNNSLGWAQLHRDYHRYYRPLKVGNMNGEQTNFFSVLPTKKGATIKIPLCCGTTFNPDLYVTTFLGQGTVEKAVFSFRDETLELDLMYAADEGLTGNAAPIANNDTKSLYVNQNVWINVIANDVDTDGTITKIEFVALPIHGTAAILSDMQISYTPSLGYVGDDYISYRVYDDWNEPSNVALLALKIYPANTPPIARNDFYVTPRGVTLVVNAPGVFANDFDDVGFTLDIYDATSVDGGTVTLLTTGKLTYVPPSPTYFGRDTFTYRIKDGVGLTSTATVEVEVRHPNAPTAVDDFYDGNMNAGLSIFPPGVLSNDTLPIAGSLTAVPVTGLVTAKGGTVNIFSDGSFNYAPPLNFAGNDTFQYLCDDTFGTSRGTVTINVAKPLWVRLVESNVTHGSNVIICNGYQAPGGTYSSADYTIYFYSDAAGTIPVSVTGNDVVVNIKTSVRNTPGGAWTDYHEAFDETAGTSTLFRDQHVYESEFLNCSGGIQSYFESKFEIEAGRYTILP